MLVLGFASGLPLALTGLALQAWLTMDGLDMAQIGFLTLIGIPYTFKFLWAPLVDRVPLPVLEKLGRRRSWIVLCQGVLTCSFAGLALTDPKSAIGNFALIAFAAAFASATQDIALDAWRIESADEASPLEVLTALYQFGYRTASIVGGALALALASRMSWPGVYLTMAGLMALVVGVTLWAPDTPRLRQSIGAPGAAGGVNPRARAVLLTVVLASWTWAVVSIVTFMVRMLSPVLPGAKPLSVADFTKYQGPWIVFSTVVVPLAVAAVANTLKARGQAVSAQAEGEATGLRVAANHIYGALVAPLAELAGRLGWGVVMVMGFILTYALSYNLWASFAVPFYLDKLHYTKDEVAFASKVFGIFMTMAGISLGGYLFTRLGRFPTVLLGAILPALGNLLYADLAYGGAGIDVFAHMLGLDRLAQMAGSDERMMRLLITIAYENVCTGLAGTAFVAYVSSVVSKRFTAIQYALLSSLTFLVGTLGRGVAGEAFDHYGYGPVFRWMALAGLVSVATVLGEWVRVTRRERKAA